MSDFERRVRFYLKSAGWRKGIFSWYRATDEYLIRPHTIAEAFYRQVREDFEQHGDVERFAEIAEKGRK